MAFTRTGLSAHDGAYGAAMALNLPLSIALLFMLISLAGLPMTIAAPAATILLTAFNYLIAATLMRPDSKTNL
jgi:hypothetical protein